MINPVDELKSDIEKDHGVTLQEMCNAIFWLNREIKWLHTWLWLALVAICIGNLISLYLIWK